MDQPSAKKNTFFLGLLAVVALLALGLSGFLWMKLEKIEAKKDTTDSEVTEIVQEVGRYLLLPPGETPELVTVSNLDDVRGQPFFANALVGDKVLVYKTASKAVLW